MRIKRKKSRAKILTPVDIEFDRDSRAAGWTIIAIRKWCRETFGPGAGGNAGFNWYARQISDGPYWLQPECHRFFFRDPAHATMFALKWIK